ncbi:hypothetical protein SAMN05216258_1185 [Albimonas pacifica]|uniref:Uncharacterized protein n=1 Tax=Albimonas pacifica TaxID=1114924 RepID=A0A1I3PK41_9RHOB|nr:hypothetical protein SAMN05216258_1185 [Albimonas pacifica]
MHDLPTTPARAAPPPGALRSATAPGARRTGARLAAAAPRPIFQMAA